MVHRSTAMDILQGELMKIFVKSSKYKRIARADESENRHVFFFDWKQLSAEEAEALAKKASIENPGKIYYVRYNDEMNPISDTYWLEGISYSTYKNALKAQKSL